MRSRAASRPSARWLSSKANMLVMGASPSRAMSRRRNSVASTSCTIAFALRVVSIV
jgi:hypothetical protein